MYRYTVFQWLLIFFTYSFLGYLWEVAFLSVKNMSLIIDKGILFGPVRTMYGAGAILLIFLALPLKNNLILVFLAGVAGATLLELTVGSAFEKIFGYKCWNYSNMLFNLEGHICLAASLLWGVFAIFFVLYIHPLIDSFIFMIPPGIVKSVAIALTLLLSADVRYSFAHFVTAR